MSVRVEHGDSRDVLRTLDADSIDSCVTDPPYHLTSIVKRFAKTGGADRPPSRVGAYARHARGFMGKTWDGGDIAFDPAFWSEVLRVLKPGAHLLAFGGTRTYHRMACALEDAGFEIRDQIGWLYGSGFPKSHDVSKGIDKAAGAEREVIGPNPNGAGRTKNITGGNLCAAHDEDRGSRDVITAPATEAARQWAGWGTALKPAWEPIVVARKPLIGTVAENVLAHGTGAINIDGCRIFSADDEARERENEASQDRRYTDRGATNLAAKPGRRYRVKRFKLGATMIATGGKWRPEDGGAWYEGVRKPGRWPANVIHDGSDEVLEAFAQYGQKGAAAPVHRRNSDKFLNVYGAFKGNVDEQGSTFRADTGTAARFFYCAKASAADRCGSKHPTVKPVALLRYLCRLITPPGGTVLDPFAGSGTLVAAAHAEGFDAILIEREPEYIADIHRRLAHMRGADTPMFAGR